MNHGVNCKPSICVYKYRVIGPDNDCAMCALSALELEVIYFRFVGSRAGFSWWEAWGPRGIGSSLKLGEQVEAPRGWGVGPTGRGF